MKPRSPISATAKGLGKMRVVVLVSLSVFVLALVFEGAVRDREELFAQDPSGPRFEQLSGSPELIALSSDVGQTYQQVTVVDPKSRVMSVYHIERATGKIELKSVRNIRWDLLMEEFNAVSPLPREIRAMSIQR